VGTRIKKTGIGWKVRKEGAECAMSRERQWERGKERNGEKRQKGDRMVERNMEEEGQNGKRKGWGIERKMLFFSLELLPLFLNKTETRNPKLILQIFKLFLTF
jgi:hypothetical protein